MLVHAEPGFIRIRQPPRSDRNEAFAALDA
jgi:hypothetical protein